MKYVIPTLEVALQAETEQVIFILEDVDYIAQFMVTVSQLRALVQQLDTELAAHTLR